MTGIFDLVPLAPEGDPAAMLESGADLRAWVMEAPR